MFAFSFIFVIGFILVFVFIVRAITRTVLGFSSGMTSTIRNVPTQMAPDGFWILSCPCQPSSIIHYSYWVAGVMNSGRIVYQPDAAGRQFIYTGGSPQEVAIVRIESPIDDTFTTMAPPIIVPPIIESSVWESSSNSSSSRFPSAY